MNASLFAPISHLANNAQAGASIELKFSDPTYQYILANFDIPEVREYTRELRAYVELGTAERDHDLTTARVCQRKSEMVTAILALAKTVRKGSPADLRAQLETANARIADLESTNRALVARIAALTSAGNGAMSIVKPLRHFVTRYLAIADSAIHGSLTLYGAKDALDQLDQEYNAQNSRSPDRLVLASLTEPNQVTLWTGSDGSRTAVSSMTDAHPHYALAKAGRGEYPDSASRAAGVRALELEAFRRLRNELVK
jgi:hypothetical protein